MGLWKVRTVGLQAQDVVHTQGRRNNNRERSQQDLEQQLRRAAQTAPTQGKKEAAGPDEVQPQENLFQRTSI